VGAPGGGDLQFRLRCFPVADQTMSILLHRSARQLANGRLCPLCVDTITLAEHTKRPHTRTSWVVEASPNAWFRSCGRSGSHARLSTACQPLRALNTCRRAVTGKHLGNSSDHGHEVRHEVTH
jgi:hypothetical protein